MTAIERVWKCICWAIGLQLAVVILAGPNSLRAQAMKSDKVENPLIPKWTDGAAYGGVPPFDRVKVAHFKPALEQAMADYRAEILTITSNPKPADFENTILALEKSGDLLERVAAVYGVWSQGMRDSEFQALEKEMSTKLAAFSDEILQNSELFKKIESVYTSPKQEKMTSEQKRLVWVNYNRFVLAGAKLSVEHKKSVATINQRLATLMTQFNQNLLADEANEFLSLSKTSDLEGLPQSVVDGYKAEAGRRGKKDVWIVSNTRSSVEPFLTYSAVRKLREKAFRMWSSRGDKDNATNNNKLIAEIVKLRTERAKLLGFATFAHWQLADTMAKEPQPALDLMMKVWKPAVERVRKEVADMQAVVDQEKGNFKIEPWDYRYYAEKVRKAKYDLDMNALTPYLEVDNVRKAMFWVAGELFGLQFKEVSGIPIFHKDVRVFKVTNKGKGDFVGLWYFDPFARPGKASGAWMTAYRSQDKIDKKPVKTIVSNNSNFVEGAAGQPARISWDDAVTMFHEFGHALHGLSSDVTYGSLSGTKTPRDFVEFPSQVLENFLPTPQVLKFLVDSNGKPIPNELRERLFQARMFNQGFQTVEYLASAIVDMKLHMNGEAPIDPRAFEKKTLTEIGMPKEIIMRHRLPHFQHLFQSEQYAASYYGYLWAQVLDKDCFEAFTETNDPYNATVAKNLKKHIFSVGNTLDPEQAYRNFRGRGPRVEALLRARGFPTEPAVQL